MYLKKIRELCSSAEGHKQYLAWLQDGVTQAMLGAVREMGRPVEPGLITHDAAYLELGKSLGYNRAADLMENPVPSTGQVGQPLEASYGAKRLEPPKV